MARTCVADPRRNTAVRAFHGPICLGASVQVRASIGAWGAGPCTRGSTARICRRVGCRRNTGNRKHPHAKSNTLNGLPPPLGLLTAWSTQGRQSVTERGASLEKSEAGDGVTIGASVCVSPRASRAVVPLPCSWGATFLFQTLPLGELRRRMQLRRSRALAERTGSTRGADDPWGCPGLGILRRRLLARLP